MLLLLWSGLVCASVVAGASFGGLLTVRQEREPLALLVGAIAIVTAAFSLNPILHTYNTSTAMLVIPLIVFASLAGGYGLVAALISYLRTSPGDPRLPRPGIPPRILTLLLADVEPERYEPAFARQHLAELADAGISGTTMLMAPILFAAHKARYRAVGGKSPELAQARSLAEKVDAVMDSDRFAGPLLVRCLDGTSLPAVVRAAAESGFSAVISAGVHVAESYRIDREKCAVDALRLDQSAPPVVYTQPLWASDRLARMVADRILAVTTEPERTGVALVLHGQPPERERTHAAFDVQENAFANRVRMFITESGIDPERTRLCWADWHEPAIAETVRHLAALGSKRVLVMPCCYPFENLNTLLDFQVEIKRARVPEDVHVMQLPPWKDDSVPAEVLAAEIEEASQGSRI